MIVDENNVIQEGERGLNIDKVEKYVIERD